MKNKQHHDYCNYHSFQIYIYHGFRYHWLPFSNTPNVLVVGGGLQWSKG